MSVVLLTSVKGAPGVTTTAVLLASCLPNVVVVEADIDGASLAVRYGLGREPGLTTLAAARTTGPDAWQAHAQDAAGVPVLVGPDVPRLAEALWQRAGSVIAGALDAADADVVVDAGRARPAVLEPMLDVAAQVVVLVRPEAEDLVTLRHRFEELSGGRAEVSVALVGQGPYKADDVAGQLGVPVVGTIPWDPKAADAVAGRGWPARRLHHTGLARAVRSLADVISSRHPAEATT